MSELSGAEWAFIVIVGLVLLSAVVCNILVMVVVGVTPKLRNPTNVLICNIAVSDLLLSSVVLPQNLHDISHSDDYHEGDFLCRVVYAGPLMCIMSSIYSMVAISFDRTQAIVLNADRKLSFRSAAIQLALIWSLSTVFAIPTIYEHREYVLVQNENGTILGCGSYSVSYDYSVINGVFIIMVAYFVPLAILLFNYGRILAFFREKGMFGKGAAERGAVFQTLYKTRMKVVKMLILIAVLFAMSWAPYFTLLLLEKTSGSSDTEHSDGAAHMLKIALSAFSTAYNFGLYIIYNQNFRLGLMLLLGVNAHARCCRMGRVAPGTENGSAIAGMSLNGQPQTSAVQLTES